MSTSWWSDGIRKVVLCMNHSSILQLHVGWMHCLAMAFSAPIVDYLRLPLALSMTYIAPPFSKAARMRISHISWPMTMSRVTSTNYAVFPFLILTSFTNHLWYVKRISHALRLSGMFATADVLICEFFRTLKSEIWLGVFPCMQVSRLMFWLLSYHLPSGDWRILSQILQIRLCHQILFVPFHNVLIMRINFEQSKFVISTAMCDFKSKTNILFVFSNLRTRVLRSGRIGPIAAKHPWSRQPACTWRICNPGCRVEFASYSILQGLQNPSPTVQVIPLEQLPHVTWFICSLCSCFETLTPWKACVAWPTTVLSSNECIIMGIVTLSFFPGANDTTV